MEEQIRLDGLLLCSNAQLLRVMNQLLGKLVGAPDIARDVAARRRTARQLQLHSAALEAAAEGMITDRQGTIVWANHAFAMMTGYSEEEILGKNLASLLSG
jgi:PAS domain-containing protein